MIFNSFGYILLLVLSRLGLLVAPWPAAVLLCSSILFYVLAGTFDFLIFSVSLLLNWLISVLIYKKSRWRIGFAAVFNIGLLFFFKYANFILSSAGTTTVFETPYYVGVVLPLGISFYTFHILAYHINVANKTSDEASGFFPFALFISFFPQLVAGPIVRPHQLLPQIERLFKGQRRKVYFKSFGLGLLVLGLFKKIILADSIAPFVDQIFQFGPENLLWAWIGALLFSFQIYLDFSGYSDIAIASAFLLGFRLPWNFRTPYLSAGPQEFWQRWHITLSSWIRDYVYIPLGGSRAGAFKNMLILVGCMSMAGLWHGANWTFFLWGFLWGVYIYVARFLKIQFLPRPVLIIGHFAITAFLWVLFRAENVTQSLSYYAVMLGICHGQQSFGTFFEERGMMTILSTLLLFLFAFHVFEGRLLSKAALYRLKRYQGPFLYGALCMVGFAILLIQHQNLNPFIYYRF